MTMTDDGMPDPFVSDLVNGLCKDIFVYRMARSMIGPGVTDAQRRSAVTRMRNAEKKIREIVFAEVDRALIRQAMEGMTR